MWSIVQSIIAGFVVIAALGVVVWVKKRALRNFLERQHFLRAARRQLKQLRYYATHRNHPVAGMLMALIAKKTAVHLFHPEGEEITLDEYGDLLHESLSEQLKECTFIARTRPSDWYSSGDMGRRIREYFAKQIRLKGHLEEKITMSRYIILPKEILETDSYRKTLEKEHNDSGIKIHFIQAENLPQGFPIRDVAIFKDKQGRGWVIESVDFNEATIKKYLKSRLPIHVKVRVVDDQSLLSTYYTDVIKTLESLAKR